jgi:coenzyme PQQ precursor peptide PqqA
MLGIVPKGRAFRADAIRRKLGMTWTCPEITEICVGMEITAYESAKI